MGEPFLVGLDLGGGSCRCLVVGLGSGRLATAARRFRPLRDPVEPLASNLDLGALWSLLGAVTREALERAGAAPGDVAGVAAASMRHASVLVDADGNGLLATSNRDARGVAASLELAARHGDELARVTGHWPNPVQPAGRLLQIAKRTPELLERARAHLSLSDWLGFRMCGELAAEPCQASETGLFGLDQRDWAWEWIERLELPRHLFPPPRDAGQRLGQLGSDAAEALGLPAGLPVAVGGADTQCALLGCGAVAPGQLAAIAGTTAPVLRVLERPLRHPEARLWAVPHPLPGHWALESNAGGMGEGLAWIAGLLHPESQHPELSLLAEAARSQPGAAGVLASLGTQRMDARALSLPVSSFTFTHLTAREDPERRRHLARGIVEGMAYSLRANAEQIESCCGLEPAPLRLGGGLSRSPLFAELLGDVLGQAVEVARSPETSALGAAICAGVGAGLFGDVAEGAERLATSARRYEPAPERSARYAELYAEWSALEEARRPHAAVAAPVLLSHLDPGPAPRPPSATYRPRILVTADLDTGSLEALSRIGEVEEASYRKRMRLLKGESLIEALKDVQVFVTEIDLVDAAAMLACPELRVVATCRGDAVNVDREAATTLGIPVIHTPGRNAVAVAELALSFMLMLSRKLAGANAFLREPGGAAGDLGRMGRAFGAFRGHELWGRSVGLVGLGAVGRELAQRLRPFGARCLASDPYLDPDAVRLAGAEPVELGELLERSDIVSLHAAVSDATRGLIGRAELARMRKGSFLINTARAALLDEEALHEALASGHLAGAALDVFSVEPPASEHPLLALPQVIATPHVGGNTHEVSEHQGRIVVEALGQMARAERPSWLLNPETWSSFSWSQPRPPPDPERVGGLGQGPAPAVTDLQKRRQPSDPAAENG